MREEIIQAIQTNKIIAIVRGAQEQQALATAKALHRGGIHLVEVTFNQAQPETLDNTLNAIRAIREQLDGQVLVGAGTVLSTQQVELAAQAGASYIISPDTDTDVIRRTRQLGLVSIPGAYTATEAKTAHNAGADFVKIFPCVSDAPAYLKALCAPLNHIRFLAVGGVNADNCASFLHAGAAGVGVGGCLVNKAWLESGEYDRITDEARRFVKNIRED